MHVLLWPHDDTLADECQVFLGQADNQPLWWNEREGWRLRTQIRFGRMLRRGRKCQLGVLYFGQSRERDYEYSEDVLPSSIVCVVRYCFDCQVGHDFSILRGAQSFFELTIL